MNERIQQLIKAAGGIGHDEDGQELTPMLVGSSLEKFAELIVRECMTVCAEREEDIRTRIKDERQAATAYMCRAYIKEHFGVEE